MYIDTFTWLYVLLALSIIVLLYSVKGLAKLKVWIKVMPKADAPMTEVGFLKMEGDNMVAEVHLPGSGKRPAIGRVKADQQSKRGVGYVEVITSDIDSTDKAHYLECGYIVFDDGSTTVSEQGYIYKQVKGSRKKELIGYCARPSQPDIPTIYGERSWKTLWLVCRLNAYLGKPTPQQDKVADGENQDKNGKQTSKKPVKKLMNIKADAEEPAVSDDTHQDQVGLGGDQPASTEKSQIIEPEDEVQSQNIPDEAADIPAMGDASITGEANTNNNDDSIVPEQSESAKAPDETSQTDELSTDDQVNAEGDALEQDEIDATVVDEAEPRDSGVEKSDSTAAEMSDPQPSEAEVPQDKNKKKRNKKATPQKKPVAQCHFTGFHSSQKDILPPEARACAYALLCRYYQRPKYTEYYKERPYGWADTALISSLIYSILFIIIYTFNTGVMQMPLLGNDMWAVAILTACYYLLWALVRQVKIDNIENNNSLQPRLDLLNKNLGMGCMNYGVIVFGTVALYFTYFYYDYDFIPLIWAIISGVMVNMSLTGAKRRWTISLTYNDKDDDETETDAQEIQNPPGDIAKTYDWELDSKYSEQKVHGNLTLYFTEQYISDMRQSNPFYSQRKEKSDKDYILDMFNYLTEHRQFLGRLRYIAFIINRLASKNRLTPLDKIQFTLDFVQEPNIQYVNNASSKEINYYEDYIRYPDETLFYKSGDCNSKSLLAAMLFHVMGYDVMYLASRRHQHSGIGIEINTFELSQGWYGSVEKIKEITIQENGRYYIYCETTGDSFVIGKTIEGVSWDDFDEKVPLRHSAESDNVVNDEESRIYNWDLDSDTGHELHGNITLKFIATEIQSLRNSNPFVTYGHDENSYEANVRNIFNYLWDDPERCEHVKAIADYMHNEIEQNKLTELDLVQFALDFVQMPNINYCVDEESAGIDYIKEYMRYPDEVLYDKEGDCDCKSSLMTALYHELGYDVIVMLSEKLGHAAVGIQCSDEWLEQIPIDDINRVVREYNGKRYIYCETTGDGYRVGHIKDGESIQDFEVIIDFPA